MPFGDVDLKVLKSEVSEFLKYQDFMPDDTKYVLEDGHIIGVCPDKSGVPRVVSLEAARKINKEAFMRDYKCPSAS